MTIEVNKIYKGDCRDFLPQLQDASIDCIISDPPYNLNKEGISNDNSLWGYELDYWRLLKEGGWLCLYCSINQLSEVIKRIEKQGFKYEWQHITYIDNGMVRGRIGFNNFMLCLIFSKGEAKIKAISKDVFKCSTSSLQRNKIDHPTPKKVGAIRQLLNAFTLEGDTVLDPFVGSGTVAVCCKNLNRNFIAFEIEEKYISICEERLQQKQLLSV